MFKRLPQVHWGSVGHRVSAVRQDEDNRDDDDDTRSTPADVVALLGFDPAAVVAHDPKLNKSRGTILGLTLTKARAALPAGSHWVTVTKEGPLQGRHILLDGRGRIQGGQVPKFFQGHPLSALHPETLRTRWREYQHLLHLGEQQRAELEATIPDVAREHAAAYRAQYGTSVHQRIRDATGGRMISSAPRHVRDLTGEFRETIPAHLKRKQGGVPIDEVAERLGTDVSGLLDLIRDTPKGAPKTARDFYARAAREVRDSDEYRDLVAFLDGMRDAAGAYRGPAPRAVAKGYGGGRQAAQEAARPALDPAVDAKSVLGLTLHKAHKPTASVPWTAAHHQAVHAAVRHVAGGDEDRARERNGVGFNKFDSDYGHYLARQKELTPSEADAAYKLARKYHAQLPEHVAAALPSGPRAATPAPAAEKQAPSAGHAPLKAGEHWITIHPEQYTHNAEGEPTHGRHVLIDGQGRIVGGSVPKSAQGKHITNWWKDAQTPEPKLHEHLRGHGVAFTHHEDGHLETGHGFREGTNKWGKPEAAPGHVKVFASAAAPPGYVALDSAFADKDRIKAAGAKFGPQLGLNFKTWYLPIDKLRHLLKEMPHAEVTAPVVARYEEWAHAHGAQTTPADVKKVEAAAAQQAQQAQQAASAEPFRLPPGMKRDAMMHGDLHNYQKAGVQFLLDQKRAILGHGVGLGKTLQAITAARAAQAEGAGPFLILCPSSRKYGWQDEIAKFSDASSVVLDASLTPKQQAARWAQIEAEKPAFIITNYETLQKLEIAKKLHELAPNVIADEAHKVKNPKAKTTAGFRQWDDARYAWLLTATPFPNGQPLETYTMLSHTGTQVVGSWKQFARDHVVFQTVRTPYGTVEKPVGLKNVAALRQKVAQVVQVKSMTDPDVGLQLPDRRRVDVALDMNKEQQKLYDALAQQIASDVAGMSDEAFQQAAAQVLVRLKRLEQIALDPDLVRPPEERTGDLSPKEQWAVETIGDHLADPKNRGMVVFADARLPLDKIYAALRKDGVAVAKITGTESPAQRQETERQFSAGHVQVVLATSAAEEGMNLQHGSHTLMHLDVPWVPKSITQREGRVHRQGQPNPFTAHYHVVHGGTVEQGKQGTLSRKARDIDALLGTHQAEDMAVGRTLSRKDVLAMLGQRPVKKSLLVFKGYGDGRGRGTPDDLPPGGHWVTMHGRHVYISAEGQPLTLPRDDTASGKTDWHRLRRQGLVGYHGSADLQSTPRRGIFWVATDPRYARGYATQAHGYADQGVVHQVSLAGKRILDLSHLNPDFDEDDDAVDDALRDALEQHDIEAPEDLGYGEMHQRIPHIAEAVRRAGYDGIKIHEWTDGVGTADTVALLDFDPDKTPHRRLRVAHPVYKSLLAFTVAKGYGDGRVPPGTPDAGKATHQLAALDEAALGDSAPTVRLHGLTPNTVWTMLRRGGYGVRITEGTAMLPGQTRIHVTRDGQVTLAGPKAAAYAAWLNGHLRGMESTAGELDGRQVATAWRREA